MRYKGALLVAELIRQGHTVILVSDKVDPSYEWACDLAADCGVSISRCHCDYIECNTGARIYILPSPLTHLADYRQFTWTDGHAEVYESPVAKVKA